MKTRNSHGLLQLGREALAYCQCASALISGNKAPFVSVDLIGEKNQVILEYKIKSNYHVFSPVGECRIGIAVHKFHLVSFDKGTRFFPYHFCPNFNCP